MVVAIFTQGCAEDGLALGWFTLPLRGGPLVSGSGATLLFEGVEVAQGAGEGGFGGRDDEGVGGAGHFTGDEGERECQDKEDAADSGRGEAKGTGDDDVGGNGGTVGFGRGEVLRKHQGQNEGREEEFGSHVS